MAELEKGPLQRFTPCHQTLSYDLAEALAVVYVDLVLIHPFRDGNGRTARLLATLMGLQAGLPTLFFGDIAGRKRQLYFAAVRAGLERNYEPMTAIFSAVIRRTLEIHGRV
jgi:cell filamentation protein